MATENVMHKLEQIKSKKKKKKTVDKGLYKENS